MAALKKSIKASRVKDKSAAIDAVIADEDMFEFLPVEFRDDVGVALLAVYRKASLFRFASERLRGDKKFVKLVIKHDAYMGITHADGKIKKDKDLVLLALKGDATAYLHIAPELKDDPDVLLRAVKTGGHVMRHFSEKNRGDRKLALWAIKQDGLNLNVVGEGLRSDKKLVELAVCNNALPALLYASEDLRSDTKFIAKLVESGKVSANILEYASDKAKSDKDFVLGLFGHAKKIGDFEEIPWERILSKESLNDIEVLHWLLKGKKKIEVMTIKQKSSVFAKLLNEHPNFNVVAEKIEEQYRALLAERLKHNIVEITVKKGCVNKSIRRKV